jgi:3-mercaptopyruvate sulfurtransferase SseA
MHKRLLVGVIPLVALMIAACAAPSPAAPTVIVEPTFQPASRLPQTEMEVPRVTVEEAWAAFESGAAVIVDVRIAESFAAGHIQGALSIPLADINTNPAGVNLDRSKWIITYCT